MILVVSSDEEANGVEEATKVLWDTILGLYEMGAEARELGRSLEAALEVFSGLVVENLEEEAEDLFWPTPKAYGEGVA